MRKFNVTVLLASGRQSYTVTAEWPHWAASWAMRECANSGLDPVRVFSVVEV